MTLDGRRAVVSAALAKTPQLTMLPDLAAKVMRVAESPASTTRDMADLIAHSPALCTRVLRVVNSPLYGLPGQVSSIERAVSLLGLEAVKNVAIAASLTRTFEGPRLSATFSPRDLWLHSLGVAAVARLLAVGGGAQAADEAFLAGLIHDIGVMIELQIDRAKLGTILRALEADERTDLIGVEEAAYQANHQDFGRGLAERWNLPPSFSAATGGHHLPLRVDGDHRPLAALVHAADRLVLDHQTSFKLDERPTDISDDVLDVLRLTRQRLDAVSAQIPAILDEASGYLTA